ncbi:MAG: hypothetical protein AB7O96_18210 [Pseudobdellovibrionaceae bacterium]
MAKEDNRTLAPSEFSIERPPSLNYVVRLAVPLEKELIIARLKSMKRQTMNFRTMSGTEALVLLDVDNDEKMVGWQGFNFDNPLNIPEKFSLHLDNEYRAFLLGLALETVLYKHLAQKNINFLMLRMDKGATGGLLDYRKKTGFLDTVKSEEMPVAWKEMCGNCELYKKSCNEQVYFKVDVRKGLEFGEKRLGSLSHSTPVEIQLVEEKIRKVANPFRAKWTA